MAIKLGKKKYCTQFRPYVCGNYIQKGNLIATVEPLQSESQSTGKSLSYTVLAEVAKCKDVEPEALQPPLHEAIDPEALDTLFADRNGTARSGKISFAYGGCYVGIESDGRVHVHDVEDSSAVGA